jgi:hypothetical protein
MYIYTYIHIYTHVYIYMYIHVYMYIYMHRVGDISEQSKEVDQDRVQEEGIQHVRL